MRTKLFNLWEKLRSSYWFLPSLMALGSILLAFSAILLDELWTPKWLWKTGWLYRNEQEGARALLSTIAGGIITVAGVVFSITIVALSLASQQFGPRLLYNFMRDRGNQFVLGTFIATYLYCLLVLRTIRQGGDPFVPHISIFFGFLLAVASLWVLIYFIHHVAESIQAMTVIGTVHEDLQRMISRLFPLPYERSPDQGSAAPGLTDDFEKKAMPVRATGTGYLQAVDVEGVMDAAERHDLVIRFEHRPGHYVLRDSVLARVLPAGDTDPEKWHPTVRKAFILGRQRTQEQDVEFLILELVEIAVRALSPGINDPHTAITCIDRLGSALAEVAGRAIPSPFFHDDQGRLRLVTRPYTFSGMVEASFDQIRQYGRGSTAVTIRLLEMIGAILPFTRDEIQRAALLRQAAMIAEGGSAFPEDSDREKARQRYLAVFEVLERTFGLTGGT